MGFGHADTECLYAPGYLRVFGAGAMDAQKLGATLGRAAFDGVGAGVGIVASNAVRGGVGALGVQGLPPQIADIPLALGEGAVAVLAADAHPAVAEFFGAMAAGTILNLAVSVMGALGAKPPIAPFQEQGWYMGYWYDPNRGGYPGVGGYGATGCPGPGCMGPQLSNPTDPAHAGAIWAAPQAARSNWPAVSFPRTMVS